jgi:hypothetical protein
LLQKQQGTKERITSIGNNMNSLIRTSAIGLLQHLQLLYLPSELDIDKQIQQVTLPFYYMQYQYHPVIPTVCVHGPWSCTASGNRVTQPRPHFSEAFSSNG